MTSTNGKKEPAIVPFIRALYPDASEEELRQAQRAMMDYLAAVLRIFDRIERERSGDSLDEENRSRISGE